MPGHRFFHFHNELSNIPIVEGGALLGLLMFGGLYRNNPHIASSIATNVTSGTITAFFNGISENRRARINDLSTKRQLTLRDIEHFVKNAREEKDKKHWVEAAENYQLAMKSLFTVNTTAEHESPDLLQTEGEVIFNAAYCLFFSGNIPLSSSILANDRVLYYAHQAQVHALRGMQYLHQENLNDAKLNFKRSLNINLEQHNIYLLSLYAAEDYLTIIEVFSGALFDKPIGCISMISDEYFDETLCYYAKSLIKKDHFQPAIAILEYMLLNQAAISISVVIRHLIHQTLAEAYSELAKLAQNENRVVLPKIKMLCSKDNCVYIDKDVVNLPPLNQAELNQKASTHKQIFDQIDGRRQKLLLKASELPAAIAPPIATKQEATFEFPYFWSRVAGGAAVSLYLIATCFDSWRGPAPILVNSYHGGTTISPRP